VFDRYRHVLDVDLQQRACEYYALASRAEEDELLQNVCEEIPPFPPRESALISRLNKKLGDTESKRTWVHGGKEANLEREFTQRINKKALPAEPAPGAVTGAAETGNDIMDSLSGLDLTSPSNDTAAAADPSSIFAQLSKPMNPAAPRLATGPNIDRWFEKLTYSPDGVLYEDVQVQIGIKSRYQGHLGQLAIYMGNKVSVPLTSFTAVVHVSDPDALSASFAKLPPSTIAPRAQIQFLLQVECKKFFSTLPNISISFLAGAQQSVTLQLPISITKFFEHVSLGAADFFERWKLIGGPPRESQLVFPITLTEEGGLDLKKYRQIIGGHQFNLLDGIDPNLNNLVGAGILHTSVDGKVGCLLRFEPNQDAKVWCFYLSRKKVRVFKR
jgi:AP-2 complex subunit alpha